LARTQVWDTAGQARFRSIETAYYSWEARVMRGYDATSEDSLRHLRERLPDVAHLAPVGVAMMRRPHNCHGLI
jgi:GTPase SAR1 family protein